MKKIQRQLNLDLSGLHVREAEGEEESRVIEGHAVVFGVRSVNLVPWSSWREVYEVMEPGCISDELLRSSDIVLTAFHDNTIILGRSRNGKGTLTVGLDKKGMPIRCELAKTERANELLSAIARGDINGMSFAYTADEDDSENGVSYEREEQKTADGKEVWVRHVKKVTGLYDVTIAGHPAYPQTDVAQREIIDNELNQRIGEPEGLIRLREEENARKAKEEAEKRESLEKEMQRRQRMLREIEIQNETQLITL